MYTPLRNSILTQRRQCRAPGKVTKSATLWRILVWRGWGSIPGFPLFGRTLYFHWATEEVLWYTKTYMKHIYEECTYLRMEPESYIFTVLYSAPDLVYVTRPVCISYILDRLNISRSRTLWSKYIADRAEVVTFLSRYPWVTWQAKRKLTG